MTEQKTPWTFAAKDFANDFPFFGAVGFICGVVQWVGYRYFDKSNAGTDLLVEHIPYDSLVLTVLFLWFAKAGVEKMCAKRDWPRLRALLAHISLRAVAFASVSAAAIAGFGLAAATFGDYKYALSFWVFSLYFLSLAEIAANPFWGPNHSKAYGLALFLLVSITVATMFAHR